jgi:hypothetical protein
MASRIRMMTTAGTAPCLLNNNLFWQPPGRELMMAAVKNEHAQLDECKSIFISWSWMIGIVISLAGTVVAGIMIYMPMEAKQDALLLKCQEKTERLEMVKSDLDTIKAILRVVK